MGVSAGGFKTWGWSGGLSWEPRWVDDPCGRSSMLSSGVPWGWPLHSPGAVTVGLLGQRTPTAPLHGAGQLGGESSLSWGIGHCCGDREGQIRMPDVGPTLSLEQQGQAAALTGSSTRCPGQSSSPGQGWPQPWPPCSGDQKPFAHLAVLALGWF